MAETYKITQSDAHFARKSKFLFIKFPIGKFWKLFKETDTYEPATDRLVVAKIPKKFLIGRVLVTRTKQSTASSTPTFVLRLGDKDYSTIQTVCSIQMNSTGDVTVNAPFNDARNDRFFYIEGEDVYVYLTTMQTPDPTDEGEFLIAIELLDLDTKEESLADMIK